jgi:hypothetical protein
MCWRGGDDRWGRYAVVGCFGEGVENVDYLDIVKIGFVEGCEVGYLDVVLF